MVNVSKGAAAAAAHQAHQRLLPKTHSQIHPKAHLCASASKERAGGEATIQLGAQHRPHRSTQLQHRDIRGLRSPTCCWEKKRMTLLMSKG